MDFGIILVINNKELWLDIKSNFNVSLEFVYSEYIKKFYLE